MCKFCDVFQTHLTRHIKRKHCTEEEVIAALKLPIKEQNRTFDLMKKSGIFKANAEIRRKDKRATLIKERRQGNADTVMCSGCLGFFDGKNIFRHKKKCSRAVSWRADTIKMTGLSECAQEIGVDDEFKTNVIDRFRSDEVGEICRNDLVVLLLGKKQWARSVKKERTVIMGEMRLFANLIHLLRAESKNEHASGLDVLDYKQFDELEKVVIKLCDKDDGQKAGLKVRIGFILKKAVNVMKGYFVMKSQFDKEQHLGRFIDVLNLNWSFIFYSAQVECELKRGGLRKPAAMPLEEDIETFRKYLLQEMENGMAQFDVWDKHTFIFMRNIILARVTMFNARRGGEPSRLTLAEWKDAISDAWIDQNLVMNVDDPMEKYLIDNLKLAYQAGKGNRKLVPVLFPMDTIEPITKLVCERINCNISTENTFLFPNTGQSTDHASGYHCLQSVVKRCPGLKQPHLLIADKFRHRVSTMFARLDIPEEQRSIFYRHMGHSESVNRNVYQCPLAVTEITKVGNFLLNSVDDRTQPQRVAYEEGEIDGTPQPQRSVSYDEMEIDGSQQSQRISNGATVNEQNVQLAGNESKQSSEKKVTKRQYTKWSDCESDIINSYFKKYITDTSNKGCLPSKKDILKFLSEYKILEGCENKATLVRSKIFNEKKKFKVSVHSMNMI